MTTTTTRTETVTTHDLREGDVVHCHGLRVKLGPVFQTRHPITNDGGATFASKGEVLNNEYLATDAGRQLFGGILMVGETWTVQGNGWATWEREVNAIADRVDATISAWVASRDGRA